MGKVGGTGWVGENGVTRGGQEEEEGDNTNRNHLQKDTILMMVLCKFVEEA